MAEINLVKLCVGAEKVEDLINWQAMRAGGEASYTPVHVTRMWPKREADLVGKGSLYWVFKGVILARQKVLRLDEVIGEDGVRRCGIVLEQEVIRTQPAPRRPFQGWRYLKPEDAPADAIKSRESESELPPKVAGALADIGIL